MTAEGGVPTRSPDGANRSAQSAAPVAQSGIAREAGPGFRKCSIRATGHHSILNSATRLQKRVCPCGAIRPRFAGNFLTLQSEGAGNAGRRSTRSRACSVGSTRVSHHEYAGNTRHSPRNGFNGFLRALPGDRALLPLSSAELLPPDLTPASGRQDHTTSPSAANTSSARRYVHRIPPRRP
jgi:hypothetical protein